MVNPGSGYTSAPGVAILNGTQTDPIALAEGGTQATATGTLELSAVNVLEFGKNYTRHPPSPFPTSPPAPAPAPPPRQ